MKNLGFGKVQILLIAAAILSIVPGGMAQQYQQPNAGQPMQQGAPMAQNSFCGNRPLCYESGDFAAMVTDFRTSDGNGFKIIDAIMHFQNKTNQTISLGYVDGSAFALDDQGNRYALNPYGGNGVRGMGVISGNNLDPKFVVYPGASGDVRFELLWRPPANTVAGVNYQLEIDIREMNRVEGNQWVLGSETLMHYQGLANGISASTGSGNANGAGTPGSSYMQGQTPATGGTMSNGYMAPVNNAVGGVTNGVTNGYSNAVGNVSNGVTNGINNAVGGVTNGYSAPNGYAPPAGYAPTNSQPYNGYTPAPNGYTAPGNVTTSSPVNSTHPATAKTATQPSVAKTTVTQPVAAKAAVPVTQRTQPAVTKAVAIQTVPAAKAKTPVPPVLPAKKPSPANPTQH